MKKKILIVSSDNILPYQPTLLNLYDALIPFFDVTIISFTPSFLAKDKKVDKNVIFINNNSLIYFSARVFELIGNFLIKILKSIFPSLSFKFFFKKQLQCYLIKKKLLMIQADHYISVDFVALKALQFYNLKSYFLSLEIFEDDPFRKKVNLKLINYVLIQSKIRYDFLFRDSNLPMLLLPNSPVFYKIEIPNLKSNLIWAGSILKIFGVLSCLDFVKIDKSYSITLKGGLDPFFKNELYSKFKNEINDNLIIINTDYFDTIQFVEFISKFKIGFCFYDLNLVKTSFNYRTAPSGKLFMYLLAGVPVIACDIEGFQFIREKKCGILIKEYSQISIKNAILEIENDYLTYQNNCIIAAKEFDFSIGSSKLIDLLKN